MIQRFLNSKNFIAFLLTSATGMTLYFLCPFPSENLFLRVIALRAPLVYRGALYSYTAMLFTTPYILYSILLSGLYIFTLRAGRRAKPAHLPPYPDPRLRRDLFLVLGEVHNRRKPVPSEKPNWLLIPERGLYTGIAIFGAVGTGKTSCCMYPYRRAALRLQSRQQRRAHRRTRARSERRLLPQGQGDSGKARAR